jgi:hypothetical protein
MADADAIALGPLCFAATAICGFFGAVAFATTPAPVAFAKRGDGPAIKLRHPSRYVRLFDAIIIGVHAASPAMSCPRVISGVP